ncbi:MAG: ATP-binding protein [Selenomonas sp.]|jgi:predicted AAA+ superfamily ATPase|nr:ATP-binding protein [Selenomonas sp.]MCI7330148.1 ATP-binding protein [Selenomonadaceae bacterium]MDD6120247.1 ATP-binding protein [Selenomonadaceae bacterium]MDD7056931.1 ATP-binding protein [Selenomonadaceae bacterium]MDY3915509.1 ATP-binding protein [Selenomonadaceae bacterium]
MVKRELYLRRIRPFYDSELVKVITGIRRCGKSTLMLQIVEEIRSKGVPEDHILVINFEIYKFRSLLSPDKFNDYVESRITDTQKYYLFFDEIQNVTDFELVVNSFRAGHNVSIFLTGSTSKLLSGELASHLGGRTLSFRVMPFTFSEVTELLREQGQDSDRMQMFRDYCRWGGFPLVWSVPADEERTFILTNLYDSIVLKDIVLRNSIKSPLILEKILNYTIANSSTTFSGNRIAGVLTSQAMKVSAPVVNNYLKAILDACIINQVERYDIRGSKLLAYEAKLYVCDLGIFQLKKNRVKDEYNFMVETIIYNELIARGYHVYVGKTPKGEIDFVVTHNQQKCYIQAAYMLSTPETRAREFGAFAPIKDAYPRYVITMDPITQDENGIRHLNLLDFLMDENSLG